MSNVSQTQILLSSTKSKIATEKNSNLSFLLEQNSKELNEFDRTLNVDLQQLYNDERQNSTIFRPTFKLDLLFYNGYSGSSNYNPYETVLYTVNENTACIWLVLYSITLIFQKIKETMRLYGQVSHNTMSLTSLEMITTLVGIPQEITPM